MADKTIGGEGIRQDWRIDKKATNDNKKTATRKQQENGNI